MCFSKCPLTVSHTIRARYFEILLLGKAKSFSYKTIIRVRSLIYEIFWWFWGEFFFLSENSWQQSIF